MNNKGSITVEMTLIFPIIIMVISLVILFSMYISDVVCVRENLEEYAITNCNIKNTNDSIKSDINKRLKNDTLISKINSIDVNDSKNKKVINVNMVANMIFFNMKFEEEINVKMENKNNKDYLIRVKVITDTFNSTKDNLKQ